jgi:hypothetical protein
MRARDIQTSGSANEPGRVRRSPTRLSPEGLGSRRDEGGEVIIIVLAALILIGVLVGALASLATPIFANAQATRNVSDTVADANAGIEYGIQTIQALLPTDAGLCPGGGAPLRNAPQVNHLLPVQVMCATSSTPASPPGISYIVVTSLAPTGGGAARGSSARAVVQVNDATGATTIESWRTCQDPNQTCWTGS